MNQEIFQVSLLVKDYDEAIAFYSEKLGFDLLEDIQLTKTKRWVRVAPSGSKFSVLLTKATSQEQAESIGMQAGGRVLLFLRTDNFDRDHKRYLDSGVTFIEEPRNEVYGKVAVFEDLYGNKWDLIEPTK